MKQVCEVLGVARSNVAAKRAQPADWRDGRSARQTDDAGLVEEIRHVVADLPSYGYRRVCGRLRRERERRCEAPVNAKRAYRVMRVHGLLLERRPTPRPQRRHDGKVAVAKSNQRWCSDVDEAIAFVNACDRPLALYWYGTDKARRDRELERKRFPARVLGRSHPLLHCGSPHDAER